MDVLSEAHITKKPLNKMYSYYEKKPSLNGFEDIHLLECINLMRTFPVYEKLGLSLKDLMDRFDPDDIHIIRTELEKDIKQNKAIIDRELKK